jgi:DUF1680 family protein
LSDDVALTEAFESDLLGGVIAIRGAGLRRTEEGWDNRLYGRVEDESMEAREFTAVPYYAWDNRGVGEMTVWINRKIQ